VIFLCHNVLPHESRFFDAPLIRWALRPGQSFIVHSQDDRSRLLDWFPNASVVCREHPVFPLDTEVTITREEARRRLNVAGRMLLFFGFVRTYKGLDVAIEALSLLESDYDDLTLWVAGEFWEDSKRYYRQIEKLGLGDRIRIEPEFLPEDELALRLAACDGVILPYRSATGSGVLGSAYASGRPVIATRTGCFKEMVIPESTGILCDPGDAQCLAQAIREFYQGEGPARFQAGVAEAAKRFSWDRILDAIEELAHVR
jgi:glycosyltransferase involved in cell wall biosynthesis